MKRQVEERAAAVWGVEPDSVELVQGVVRSKTDESLQMTFGEVAAQMADTGGPIMGSAVVHPRGIGPSSSGNIVDVQVDPETGKVDILRYTAFQDAGKAIHPTYVEGQMQGGSVQGLGWALNEEYDYDENGSHEERQLSRLSHAYLAGRADDRYGHSRGAEPRDIRLE